MKNKIPTNVLHVEEILVAYNYIKVLPTPIAMWAKRAHRTTLQEYFLEAILVEKYVFFLKDNPDA